MFSFLSDDGEPETMHNFMIKKLTIMALFSSVLTFVAWAALHLVPQKQSWHWIIYPGALLTMPGGFLATAAAAIFSPQGFHGIDDFSWLIVPTNLVFYFLLFFFLLQRRKSSRTA